jgi:hypothetical protein
MATTTYDLIVPNNYPKQLITYILDGVTYSVELTYTVRSDRWVLSISDSINFTLKGIILQQGIDMLGQFHYLENCPEGELVCLSDDISIDVNKENFPALVSLSYVTEDE